MEQARPMAGARGVLCVSQYCAGSTWMYNLVARLFELARGGDVTRLYVDELDVPSAQAMGSADFFVAKCHKPGPILTGVLGMAGLPVVLTVRDPCDAAVSLMQRFGFGFDRALFNVTESARALVPLATYDRKLLLRYEDRFTTDPTFPAKLATWLGLTVSTESLAGLAEELSVDAVKTHIEAWRESGGPMEGDADHPLEPGTHWHVNHIGDGRIDKWREFLEPGQAASVLYATRLYGKTFEYAPARPIAVGAEIGFAAGCIGQAYLGDGFSIPEPWGIWTDGTRADLILPLGPPTGRGLRLTLELACAGPLRHPEFSATGLIIVNDEIVAEIGATPARLERLLTIALLPPQTATELAIRFEFNGLRSPAELGESSDARRIGFGLISLRLDDRGPPQIRESQS